MSQLPSKEKSQSATENSVHNSDQTADSCKKYDEKHISIFISKRTEDCSLFKKWVPQLDEGKRKPR